MHFVSFPHGNTEGKIYSPHAKHNYTMHNNLKWTIYVLKVSECITFIAFLAAIYTLQTEYCLFAVLIVVPAGVVYNKLVMSIFYVLWCTKFPRIYAPASQHREMNQGSNLD